MKTLIFKTSLKEFFHYKKFTWLFIFNLSLGLIGITLVENFKYAFQNVLDARSKNLLGADLAVRSRFPLSDEQLKGFRSLVRENSNSKDIELVQQLSFFSMISVNGGKPRLVSLYTLNDRYPFYGHLTFSDNSQFPGPKTTLPGEDELWGHQDLIAGLGEDGDYKINLGGRSFRLTGLIIDDDQQAFSMSSLAPKIFIKKEVVKKLGLIQKGSTLRYAYFFKTDLRPSAALLREMNDFFDDSSIIITTPAKTSEQVGQILSYLSDFLGLVSLISLFLASVGLFYLFRTHMQGKRQSFAIYNSLGISLKDVRLSYWLYSSYLAVSATVFALGISQLLIPAVNNIITNILGLSLQNSIHPQAVILCLFVGIGGTILLVFPILKVLLSEKVASLFQEVQSHEGIQFFKHYRYFIPYAVFFMAMTLYLANSFRTAGWFLGLFIGSVLLIFPISSFLLKKIYHVSQGLPFLVKLSVRYLYRFKFSTISIFLCLSLGCMLINIIPQVERSIRGELNMDDKSEKPQYFLFDIQDEQVGPLKEFLKTKEQNVLGLSPMVRARLNKINDEDVVLDVDKARTREEQQRRRSFNRGFNLGYRAKPLESETIIEGEMPELPFDEERDGLPAVSIVKSYAKRFNLTLGDTLEFNILGVAQKARVTSIRTVKWTSFVPNFLIQFQTGVLENAPKTWLAAIRPLNKDDDVRAELIQDFPNISIVNISQVIDKILKMMTQMSFALKSMSILCLLVGFMVLYSLIGHQIQERQKDIKLLTLIGMSPAKLRKMIVGEFLSIVTVAATLGGVLGLAVSFLLGKFLFSSTYWSPSFILPLSVLLGVVAITIVVVSLAMRSQRLLR